MGLAVTRHLLANDWCVCLCDLNQPPAEEDDVKKALGDEHAMFVSADVADHQSLAAVFVAAWARWGRLDFGEPEQEQNGELSDRSYSLY